ncbi:MAG: class I SAM-dependent methyltransferase [Pirellulaceae bacterium]
MVAEKRPHWQLPSGVTRGLWDYVHSSTVADDYDEYFAHNRLFQFDEQVLLRELEVRGVGEGKVVADLGCGTGRALLALARRGLLGVAIDLSPSMLDIVRLKALDERLPILCLRSNLVELDALADNSVDAAISLFSTLGMIQGRGNRQRALQHVSRIVKPGGPFVMHVHNYWYHLSDPGGPWWLIANLWRSCFQRDIEAGDKYFNYRGVPNMFLHLFRRSELTRSLRRAGFRIRTFIPLDPRRHRALRWPWLLGAMRANGWIAVCEVEKRCQEPFFRSYHCRRRGIFRG